jgi:lipopolysaccharide biosynthesis regulator YciM
MVWLFIVILAILVVALYPIVRDYMRKRRTAAPSYVEGLQAIIDGRTAEAIARLKDTVHHDTDNIDAYIRLGDLLIQQGETDRGIRLHENLALRRSMDKRDERRVYHALVRDYTKVGRSAKAISLLEELGLQHKGATADSQKLAELYIATGTWEKCEGLLGELAKSPASRLAAARLYTEYGRAVRKDRPEAAKSAFESALRLDPASIEARVLQGDYLLESGDTEAAIRTWNELLTVAPEQNALVRNRLERAYFDSGRFEDVTTLYERLLRKVPRDAGLAIALAAIYRKKEDVNAAVRLLERIVAGGSADTAIRSALAGLYLEQGEDMKARAELAAVLASASEERGS